MCCTRVDIPGNRGESGTSSPGGGAGGSGGGVGRVTAGGGVVVLPVIMIETFSGFLMKLYRFPYSETKSSWCSHSCVRTANNKGP